MCKVECCDEHKEHAFRLKRDEEDIQLIWKEIDSMKKWVITGMSGLLIQIVVIVIGVVLTLVQG